MQTVYDVFAVAPLGAGVVDPTAGSTLVTGYFTGQELKNLLEFFLVDSPAHPGEYFPRASGMRFRYDPSRPKFDVVTAIEMGDLDRGYSAIDISGKDETLVQPHLPPDARHDPRGHPEIHQGQTAAGGQEQGRPAPQIESRGPRRPSRRHARPAAAAGHDGQGQCRHATEKGAVREIKEWQAIMDHLRSLPVKRPGELPMIPVDERAAEVRAIKVG